jgi:hypothetical protein
VDTTREPSEEISETKSLKLQRLATTDLRQYCHISALHTHGKERKGLALIIVTGVYQGGSVFPNESTHRRGISRRKFLHIP